LPLVEAAAKVIIAFTHTYDAKHMKSEDQTNLETTASTVLMQEIKNVAVYSMDIAFEQNRGPTASYTSVLSGVTAALRPLLESAAEADFPRFARCVTDTYKSLPAVSTHSSFGAVAQKIKANNDSHQEPLYTPSLYDMLHHIARTVHVTTDQVNAVVVFLAAHANDDFAYTVLQHLLHTDLQKYFQQQNCHAMLAAAVMEKSPTSSKILEALAEARSETNFRSTTLRSLTTWFYPATGAIELAIVSHSQTVSGNIVGKGSQKDKKKERQKQKTRAIV